MLVAPWLVFYQNQKRAKSLPNHPHGKYEYRIKIANASVADGRDMTKKPNALWVTDEDRAAAGRSIYVILSILGGTCCSFAISLVCNWPNQTRRPDPN